MLIQSYQESRSIRFILCNVLITLDHMVLRFGIKRSSVGYNESFEGKRRVGRDIKPE
jgi:hypothetical protein